MTDTLYYYQKNIGNSEKQAKTMSLIDTVVIRNVIDMQLRTKTRTVAVTDKNSNYDWKLEVPTFLYGFLWIKKYSVSLHIMCSKQDDISNLHFNEFHSNALN